MCCTLNQHSRRRTTELLKDIHGTEVNVKTDLTGEQVGLLKIIGFHHKGKNSLNYWECLCECGKVTVKAQSHLLEKNNKVKSCGCIGKQTLLEALDKGRTKHRLANHPLYHTAYNIQQRTCNKNCSAYKDYGGRGVKLYPDWVGDVGVVRMIQFLENMPKPTEYVGVLSVDRMDNNGDYVPENLRWATKEQQSRNQRMRKINTSGVTGVCFHESRGCWIAYWHELSGKQKMKSFSCKKYGYNLAFKLACETREAEMLKLQELGAGYSETHGLSNV